MFTWSNNRANPTFEKLDRFFVSHDWDLSYMNSLIKGLNRDLSDHVPLMLCIGKDIVKHSIFIYELSWIKRPNFKDVVMNSWNLLVRNRKSFDVWKEK
jgi:hypothetical protein